MKSTERFSTRVEAYREHRPRYPKEVVELLRRECGLTPEWVVADVAAGTGLLAEIFLDNGNRVIAIEPNGPMRAACEELKEKYPRLECVKGTAEATGLADGVADLVTVGQAMHWFDLEKTRAEFVRVLPPRHAKTACRGPRSLKPDRWCAVVYNHRKMGGDGFHEGYERLLVEFGGDYRAVQSRHMTEDKLAGFFAPSEMRCAVLPNHQDLTLEGLQGRVLSSSYMPQEGHEKYPAMMDAIAELFARYAKDGVVRMEYKCEVCFGQIG